MKYLKPKNYYHFIKKLFLNSEKKIRLFIRNSIFNINLQKVKSYDELINLHFNFYSEKKHSNFNMFHFLLNNFDSKPLNILETGSSAHGTNSSHLFINYIKKFGGSFYTVDINPDIKNSLMRYESDTITVVTADSVQYLKSLDENIVKSLDVIFLDSFDLDLINPEPSEHHGLMEFESLSKNVKKGCLISIDDTPSDYSLFSNATSDTLKVYESQRVQKGDGYIPGKGRKVLDLIASDKSFEVIFHEYSVVVQKINE